MTPRTQITNPVAATRTEGACSKITSHYQQQHHSQCSDTVIATVASSATMAKTTTAICAAALTSSATINTTANDIADLKLATGTSLTTTLPHENHRLHMTTISCAIDAVTVICERCASFFHTKFTKRRHFFKEDHLEDILGNCFSLVVTNIRFLSCWRQAAD